MLTPPYLCSFPVAPLLSPPEPTAYYGLLTDPVGRYGKAPYGASTAYSLRGCETFIRRAHNLFDSFGGETINGPLNGTGKRWTENRPVVLRSTPNPEVWFFCMPPLRVRAALRTYLYCKLYAAKGQVEHVLDEDGDRVDSICHNEMELDHEAAVLAETFYHYEIRSDYAALPEYQKVGDGGFRLEHSVNEAEGGDDDGA